MVYLVDDDESVRRALQRLLRSAGFEVKAFSSAEAFLKSENLDVKSVHRSGHSHAGIDRV